MRLWHALTRRARAKAAEQPQRDRDGRFVSDTRARVLARARQMRREQGKPPLAILNPFGDDE